jgi:uncharacterized protein YcbK (DUF882 family)
MLGAAADIRIDGDTEFLLRCVHQIPEFQDGGIGKYNSFIHVDVRGCKARWSG